MSMDRIPTEVKNNFSELSLLYDQNGTFPTENFEKLHELGLLHSVLPRDFGGNDLTPLDMVNLISELAEACSSTALCFAMHCYSVKGLNTALNDEQKKVFFNSIANETKIIASISNPNILLLNQIEQIRKVVSITVDSVDGEFYELNGIKHFVSGSPITKYLPVFAFHRADTPYGISAFIIDTDTPGVELLNNWNYSGMRSSGSHSVKFTNVKIQKSCLIGREGYGIEDTQNFIYWFRVALVSVYLGLSRSLYKLILDEVLKRKDYYSSKSIGFLPNIQYSIAEMKILLENSSNSVYSTVEMFTNELQKKTYSDELYIKTLITKSVVTNNAVKILDLAMRIIGTSSLSKGSKFEKLFRDVHAGIFHPPNDDLLKEVIAKKELGIIVYKNRWI